MTTFDRTEIPPPQITYTDDAAVLRQAESEDYSLHIVPNEWRGSPGAIAMVWFSMMSAMYWVIVGSTVAINVGTVNALIGMALTVVVSGLVTGTLSWYASRSGTSVAQASRAIFGQAGGVVAAAILGLGTLWFGTFEASVAAVALHTRFEGVPLKVWYAVVVAVSIPLVFRGVLKWLDKLNGVLLPIYAVGLIGAVVWAIAKYGYSGDWLTFEATSPVDVGVPGWWYAFCVNMGGWTAFLMAFDFARFGRKKDARTNARWSFGIPFWFVTLLINGAIGILLTTIIPIDGPLSETSAIVAIVNLMGLWGVIFVWASQTRINTANFYLSSTNWQNFFARTVKIAWPRTVWTVIVGAVIFLFMLTNVMSYLVTALLYNGVLMVTWVAIALVHVAWTWRRGMAPEQAEVRPGRVPMVNPGGLCAWTIGVITGVLLIALGGPRGGVWGPPAAFAVSAVSYALALAMARDTWFVSRRPHDPRTEVDDEWQARMRCHRCGLSYIAHEMDRDPSAGHQTICLACASDHGAFLREARAEARAFDESAAATAAAETRPLVASTREMAESSPDTEQR